MDAKEAYPPPNPQYTQQQPQMQQGMSMTGGGNRNVKGLPVVDKDGKEVGRDWSHGLCSCTDACGTCEFSFSYLFFSSFSLFFPSRFFFLFSSFFFLISLLSAFH
jgi:hypothetical protein